MFKCYRERSAVQNMNQSFLESSTPKEGMRKSAKLFCYVFAVVFAICLITFLILAIIGFVEYINALNSPACAGMDPANGLGQSFSVEDLGALARGEAIATYGEATVNETPWLIENVKATILGKYTLKNGVYYYNMLPIIDPKCWIYIGVCTYLLALIVIQIYVTIRIEKAKYTKYYTQIVLLFVSLNLPSAMLLIYGRKD